MPDSDGQTNAPKYEVDQFVAGNGDLRFIAATQEYDRLVAFYGRDLRMPIYRSWDRPDGRGTLLRAAGGTLEILDAPVGSPYVDHGGIGMGIEVDDVEEWWERAKASRAELIHEPTTEFTFRVCRFLDPAGIVVMPFRKLDINDPTGSSK